MKLPMIRLHDPVDDRPMIFSIVFRAWHPTRLNVLLKSHWSKGYSRKKHDKNAIAVELFVQGVTNAICFRVRRRVSLAIYGPISRRRADPDSYWKVVLDGLVACGALVDDSAEWVEMGSVVYHRADEIATRIILEDLPS